MKHCLSVFFLVCLFACSKQSDLILDHQQMVDILTDVYKGEVVLEYERSRYYNDSLKQTLEQSVYAKHSVTKEQFDSSLAYYGRNMEEYIDICDDVIQQLEKEIKQNNGQHHIVADGDSVDIWPASPLMLLTKPLASSHLTIAVPSDTKTMPGDAFTLKFKYISLKNINSELSASLVATYDGDTIIESKTAKLGPQGWLNIKFVSDSTLSLKQIDTNIFFPEIIDESHIYIDSISLVRTRLSEDVYRNRNSQRHFIVK